MPYLDHPTVLDAFAAFLRTDVREAIPEEEAFVRAQVGSMASTMDFLSSEAAGLGTVLARQEAAFEAALESLEASFGDDSVVGEQVAAARERLAVAPEPRSHRTLRERESALLGALDELLAAADELPTEQAREVRRPLYDVLDERIDGQLSMLQGDFDEGGEDR